MLLNNLEPLSTDHMISKGAIEIMSPNEKVRFKFGKEVPKIRTSPMQMSE